ncbi:hypothetical protein EY04_09825 [Pseudomonas chlororaphis]|nr:hypothetical protein EY04_09825 [Pseudomonas chlororaphis]
MPRHSPVFHLSRATGDHDILADVCPRFGPCPGSRHAQCSSCAQAAHQFALESPSTLNVERLVYGFMRDTHGFIVRKIDLEPVGNLFGRPAINPSTVTAMWLISAFEGSLSRPSNLTAISVMNLTLQTILHVVMQ